MSSRYILAIETSCDETAVAVLRSDEDRIEILSNQISSQIELHAQWGGVVPNLAAREHVKNLPLVLEKALKQAGISLSQVELLTVVNGPGLIPALMVGVNFAKTLAYRLEKPLIGIHHIEGHIYANFISDKIGARNNNQDAIAKQNEIQNSKFKIQNFDAMFPVLALVVSGGHTQLVLMKDHFEYEIIGQTLDDAVGEAFDKVARILDIGYPGGPAVAQQAANYQLSLIDYQKKSDLEAKKLSFPRPMLHSKDFNFSFSGLKTAVLYETKKIKDELPVTIYELLKPEICHEFQSAAVEVLVSKTIKAAKEYNPRTIMLAGGVSANKHLRESLGATIKSQLPATGYYLPDLSLTGDNAAMIAAAAHFRWRKMSEAEKEEAKNNWKTLQTDANLKLSQSLIS